MAPAEARQQLHGSTAYARRCYVTVRVQSAGFGGAEDYVVSTMVNGEQVLITKTSALPLPLLLPLPLTLTLEP